MVTTELMTAAEYTSDAELVSRTLAGDQDAFTRIVSRYQILICSLAYSRIGRIGQSEDVAQETFITAWKHLRLLRKPEKLRAWLCGIVRNRTKKCLQGEGREPAHDAEPLEAVDDSVAPEALPSEQAMGREEEAILWRSLERIPELYREPLILFYREHQSIEFVAAELELSEDAVRQRLSRGRKLLHEEVLAFVEGALRRSAPTPAFSNAVLAALPWAAGPMATAGVSTAGKGTVAAKSGLLAVATCLAPFIGIFTGFAAQWLMVRGATGRERRARRIELVVTWIWVAGFAIGGQYAVHYLGHHLGWSDRVYFALVAGFWWFFAMVMATWITRIYRKIQARSQPDTETGDILHGTASLMKPGIAAAVVGGTHFMMFWGVIFMAWRAQDRLGAAIIVGLMVALAIWNYFKLRGQAGLAMGGYIGQLASGSAVVLAIFNLRFDVWVAPAYGISVAELHDQMPTWMVPLLTLVVVLWTGILLAMTKPKRGL
jgi:RNA polymerase sigma factor (sigma-70 family)